MSKSLRLAVCLLLTVVCTCDAYDRSSVRQDVKIVYDSQVGVRELTGKNDGDQVEIYLRSVGLRKGNSWCAAFVCWVFDQVGVSNPNTGWSPAMFNSKNTIYKSGVATETPQSGDVFGIWFSNLNRIAHVGFVDKWSSKSVNTVEGNTNGYGSREGNGVYRKIRLRKQIYKVAKIIR